MAPLRALSLLLVLYAVGFAAKADTQAQPGTAHRITGPLALDGVLDEADWRQSAPIDRFFETYPGSLRPAPEHTEVRVLYDDSALYVGLRMDLDDPARLRKPFVRRDKVNFTHDYVQVYLDPQGARRGSYLFRVNARGTRTDGYQNEDAGTETLDPDYDWSATSHVDGRGWSAELRIPLSTLRIARSGPQAWAVVVTRGVPRDQNTQMASAPFPHDASCFLCFAGTVEFPDLRPRADRLLLTPSLVVDADRTHGTFGEGSTRDARLSLDAKWLPRDGEAVDLTVDPDFSQVEADSAQLLGNARFALDLPEKRPFFREGADLVSTGIPVVYTRTIAAPRWGLRYTRRSVGLEGTAFFARDGGRAGIVEPGFLGSSTGMPDFDSDVGFARWRDNLGQASVGGLVAMKRNDDDSRNAVGGVDATWASGADRVTAQVLGSATRNPERPDLLDSWLGQSLQGSAALLAWDHSTRSVWSLRYERVASGFRSWLGYVPRVGYQQVHGEFRRPFYSNNRWLNTIAPYASLDDVEGIDGEHGHERDPAIGVSLAGYRSFSGDISWHGAGITLNAEGEERATQYLAWQMSASPSPRLPLVALTGQRGNAVDFASGDVVPNRTIGMRAIARPLDRLEVEARYDRNLLAGTGGSPDPLFEDARQLFATWHLDSRLYALLTWQRSTTVRTSPEAQRERRTVASLQFDWDVGDWKVYWGLRTGRELGIGPADAGDGREVYLKLAWTGRW